MEMINMELPSRRERGRLQRRVIDVMKGDVQDGWLRWRQMISCDDDDDDLP